MLPFQDRPIKQKLAFITLVTTGIALLLAGVGNLLVDSILFRSNLRRDLTVLARVIADNSTAALAFNDQATASQTLGALKERSHIAGACIYRNSGQSPKLFTEYTPAAGFHCPQLQATGTIPATRRNLSLAEPIVLDGRTIGTLVLFYDLGELNQRITLYGTLILGVFVAALFLALLLSNRLRQAIATPVARLVRATTAVSETGDYSVRAEKLSGDELGVLVDRFNEMLARTQEAFHQVEKERARFQFMAESMPQKIFTATANGEVDYFNRQWVEFTGLTFDEIKGSGWARFLHPDDLEEAVRAWKDSLRTGEPFHCQQRFRRADGKYYWHLTRALAMRDASGNITMWIGSNTDIHDQKEKEEELRRANEDLQQFAYSASHDLQEPIRNVAIYSEIVARNYHELLDDEGRQFLGFLKEGGHRLAALVNDLLAYTRASMAELSDQQVDASEALQTSLTTLADVIRDTGALVTADDLPRVHMGSVHLQQIFQNLIGNALKYRSEEPPRIHVCAGRTGRMWRFSVRDNGIGIDPEYKEKIFGVFKRLSHDRNNSGTGIGLAICQRIVERYGGRIWVESQLGKGATFLFTVPQPGESSRSALQPSDS
ncbi:MAG: PAS domain-containing protein [Acidobacteriia bacterium]|nr:PAS domain-containing protein [Terriglobia bacterium]